MNEPAFPFNLQFDGSGSCANSSLPADISPESMLAQEAEIMRQINQGEFGETEAVRAPLGPPQIFDCVQLSAEWWSLKRGIPSAGSFDRILTAGGKPSAQQDNYIAELIADKVCPDMPVVAEHGISKAMDNGINREPEARQWYSMQTDQDVRIVGFILTADGRLGCSPDGLVGEDGGLELKCPMHKTHVKYLMAGGIPTEYKPQVHGCLIVTGRKFWDMVSYCPGLPPLMVRVTPDAYTKLLRDELERFTVKLERARKRIGGM